MSGALAELMVRACQSCAGTLPASATGRSRRLTCLQSDSASNRRCAGPHSAGRTRHRPHRQPAVRSRLAARRVASRCCRRAAPRQRGTVDRRSADQGDRRTLSHRYRPAGDMWHRAAAGTSAASECRAGDLHLRQHRPAEGCGHWPPASRRQARGAGPPAALQAGRCGAGPAAAHFHLWLMGGVAGAAGRFEAATGAAFHGRCAPARARCGRNDPRRRAVDVPDRTRRTHVQRAKPAHDPDRRRGAAEAVWLSRCRRCRRARRFSISTG